MEELVAFKDEWDFGRRYLETQRSRSGDRLRFDLRMLGEPGEHCIPPLTLQPLLENAIEHGLRPRSGSGRILVRVRFHKNAEGRPRWWMVVRDDGVGPVARQNEASEGHAEASAPYVGETLSNLRFRLEHLLEGGGLWIRPASAGGTVAVLTGGPPRKTLPTSFGESLS